ncbi:hypothetical protein C5B42_04250 [Candidatus Cerribacteria bacterium 'Amazon FNV 2010 28 9']|uniref:Uncharacterized protein n=1 Tax=Candidatus Cerribacteria bacterium 'Amazon FNV 2010 28 9' TaxID=2081795 RepID=A0A317JNK0_9BACT|nr:MAG: hypothetical protein C5B42_04250 [Candidatus Cerribacteria bacterium 'Amazon FNV 2010 28 9']
MKEQTTTNYRIIADPDEIQQLRDDKKIHSWLCGPDSEDHVEFVLNWNGVNYMFTATQEQIDQIQAENVPRAEALLVLAFTFMRFNNAIYNALHNI